MCPLARMPTYSRFVETAKTVRLRGGFTPPNGELNSPLQFQTLPLPEIQASLMRVELEHVGSMQPHGSAGQNQDSAD
jgi:hypothetical protein